MADVASRIGVAVERNGYIGRACTDPRCGGEHRCARQWIASRAKGAQCATGHHQVATGAVPHKAAAWVFTEGEGDGSGLSRDQIAGAAAHSCCGARGVHQIMGVVCDCDRRECAVVARSIFQSAAIEVQCVCANGHAIAVVLSAGHCGGEHQGVAARTRNVGRLDRSAPYIEHQIRRATRGADRDHVIEGDGGTERVARIQVVDGGV